MELAPVNLVTRVSPVVCLLAAIGLLQACAGGDMAAGGATARGRLIDHSIDAGGHRRSYLLYTPADVEDASTKRPLLLVFHGGGGHAMGIANEVGRSLHRIADREKILVAYPEAFDEFWDFGVGVVSQSLEVRVDDRAYLAALLDELSDTRPVDERRIFATGMSRGGQASYFIACSFPDRIRAIAPVAMPMPKFMLELCTGVSGVGVAILNGTADPVVPYDGGQIVVGGRQRGEVISTDDTVAFWRARNGCASEPTTRTTLDPTRDRMQVQWTIWEDCRQDPVHLYRIEGGGHTWPSGRQYLPRFVVGRVNRDIDGATEVWSFFSRFR